MDTNQYKVIILPNAYKEMTKIYNYITEELYTENAARKIMRQVEEEIQRLKYSPYIHPRIEKKDELQRTYRRIVIKNHIILYVIEEEEKVVIVSHMYNARRNYLDNYLL